MEPVKGSQEISLQNAALRSVSRLKGRPLYISRFPLRGTPRRGKGCTRVRIIMILLRQFMQGQLRLTWRSYAGPPQSVQHRVSFRHLTSYTPAPRRGPLPLKGAQDVTGLAFVSLWFPRHFERRYKPV